MNNLYSFTSGWLIHGKKMSKKAEAANSAEKDHFFLSNIFILVLLQWDQKIFL